MYASKRMYAGGSSRAAKRFKKKESTTGKVARLQRVVAALRPEVKRFVNKFFTAVTVNTQVVNYISGVAIGNTDETRIGKKIRLLSATVSIRAVSVLGGNEDWTSIYLVKDNRSNGATMTVAGVPTTSLLDTFNPLTAVPLQANRERFKILKQWDYHGGQPASDTLNPTIPGPKQKFMCNFPLTYGDDTAAVTGADTNALYLVYLTSDASSGSNFYINCEMDFTDV